ncbi:MAG: SIR2 family protein [Gemmataceae bacterium]|nr:SIR2 family protein [Gemmataceae bacterium]
MDGHLFIVPGDVTQLAADAVAYSASNRLGRSGSLYPGFAHHFPTFGPWYKNQSKHLLAPCSVGETFWMPLDPARKPHGIVVVVATGGAATDEDKATTAVRSAVDSAVENLRGECGRTDRLLIALPAFRVGMGGDRNDRVRSARAQVRAALDALRRHSNVDVAIVTYTPALYQIFLEARRQVLGPLPAEGAPPAALVEALLAQECVLFVGAGLSCGAGLPDWSELIRRLAEQLKITPDGRTDYPDLAQWYREQFGASALAGVIHQTFGDPNRAGLPTLAHYLLLSLPIRLVLTTNYDGLLELALTALKRFPVPVVRQEDVAKTGQGDGVYVVKLHGDAASAEEIVLCRDDYDEFFERRPAMALLLEGLLLNRTFFFVGYGLRDANFRQLYSRIGRMLRTSRRPAFATTFETTSDSHASRQWRNKHLNLIAIPAASVAEQQLHFLRYLDRLVEEVTLRTPGLFLAPDVEAPPVLAKLRKVLLERVGDELEAVAQHPLTEGEAQRAMRPVIQVLEFLIAQGWRPNQGRGLGLCALCEQLAGQAANASERRRLLALALASAEAFADAERIRGMLTASAP